MVLWYTPGNVSTTKASIRPLTFLWQFTLPSGMILYGILMEYVEGSRLDSDFARKLSPESQIKMVWISFTDYD